jgi:alpha/beta superfamily hydrolase
METTTLISSLPLEVNVLLNGKPKHAFVLCHPFAPMGGNFNNSVISSLFHELSVQDSIVCRFNFRGAGNSGGKTSPDGEGEEFDVQTVVNWLNDKHSISDITLIGYSYGAMIAASCAWRIPAVKQLLCISYPFAALDRLTLYSGQVALQNAGRFTHPSLFACGDEDEFCPDWPHCLDQITFTSPPTIKTVIGANHFWTHKEDDLAQLIHAHLFPSGNKL